jgi:hypothetical protein
MGAVVAVVLLCGCAVSKEARVRTALTDAGVPKPMAACMADIMADDLTVDQLRAMADAAALVQRPVQEVTFDQAMRTLRTVGDPAVIGTLALATTSCVGRL